MERERQKKSGKKNVARGDPYAICLPHFRLRVLLGYSSLFFVGRLPNEGGRPERSNKMKHIFYTNRRCSQRRREEATVGRIASR